MPGIVVVDYLSCKQFKCVRRVKRVARIKKYEIVALCRVHSLVMASYIPLSGLEYMRACGMPASIASLSVRSVDTPSIMMCSKRVQVCSLTLFSVAGSVAAALYVTVIIENNGTIWSCIMDLHSKYTIKT